jgi:hypothetical protein
MWHTRHTIAADFNVPRTPCMQRWTDRGGTRGTPLRGTLTPRIHITHECHQLYSNPLGASTGSLQRQIVPSLGFTLCSERSHRLLSGIGSSQAELGDSIDTDIGFVLEAGKHGTCLGAGLPTPPCRRPKVSPSRWGRPTGGTFNLAVGPSEPANKLHLGRKSLSEQGIPSGGSSATVGCSGAWVSPDDRGRPHEPKLLCTLRLTA